jgi:hypothetical protein
VGEVRANRGAAGIDRVTLAAVEQYGVSRLLDELAADLKAGSYRLLPARRVLIPKPGSQERRPLSIPRVRDRIVQTAAKTVPQTPARPARRGDGGGRGQTQREWYAAGRGDDCSYAVGNFEFERSIRRAPGRSRT